MSLLLYPIKRRSQRVATQGVAFDDRRDFIADDFVDAGEPHPALTSPLGVAPRPYYVHRSYGRGFPDSPPLTLTLRDIYPALDLALRRRRVAWGAQKGTSLVRSSSPRSRSARVAASWAEFNRLRLDPRTATCVRRRARREVLFAKRVAGGRGMRTYRRNHTSQWSCRP